MPPGFEVQPWRKRSFISLLQHVLSGTRPHLDLRVTKGGRPRRVPLWWDSRTLTDLEAWRAERLEHQADSSAPFLCSLRPHRFGLALGRHTLRRRFRTACKCLGMERLRMLTIHHGRHTFISHALAGGRTIAEVRAAAGHASLVTTSAYLHVAVDDDEQPGRLFAY